MSSRPARSRTSSPTPRTSRRPRIIERYVGGEVDPRIEITPSGFNALPSDTASKLPEGLPAFHEVNPREGVGARLEDGYTPYSQRTPDPA